MPPVLIWFGGALALGYVLDKTGEAAEGSAKLAKWGTIGGGVYVSYAALKSFGVLK